MVSVLVKIVAAIIAAVLSVIIIVVIIVVATSGKDTDTGTIFMYLGPKLEKKILWHHKIPYENSKLSHSS
jgi:hypothetical protein